MRWLAPIMLVAILVGASVTSCSGSRLKQNGEACNASSECDIGLLCDLGREPHVCAGMGAPDAAEAPVDSDTPIVDGSTIDSPPTPIDAPPDAPVDAPPDAPPDAML